MPSVEVSFIHLCWVFLPLSFLSRL